MTCSAASYAARVDARVLSASIPVAEGGGAVRLSVAVLVPVGVPSIVRAPVVARDEDGGTPSGVAGMTVTAFELSLGAS